jgi:hypothetical protein
MPLYNSVLTFVAPLPSTAFAQAISGTMTANFVSFNEFGQAAPRRRRVA